MGADRIVLGSDYCFSMGCDRPLDILKRLDGLTKADRSRILSGNAERSCGSGDHVARAGGLRARS